MIAPGDELTLEIDRLAFGGEGVARAPGGMVVFVDRAAPGERVRAVIRSVKRRHAEAEVVAVERASGARVEPRCRHFVEGCGGCTWQHLAYASQLEAKAASVRDSLERIGGFASGALPLRPIVPAAHPWLYRGKMEFAFNASSGIGLHPRGHWDRVLPLQTCHLQEPPSVDIALAARAFVRDRGMSCWEPRARVGFLRDLVVRSSRSTGEVMVGIVTGPGPFPEAAAFAERLSAVHPRIVGVLRAIRSGPADGAPLERVEVLTGRATITEEIAGFRFDIGLSTFFQPNAAQAERLVELVLEAAGPLDATARVVDLYCGVGMFTLPLSRRAGSVDGVEMANAAVIAARENAARNGVANVTFHAGDARHVLPDLLADTPGAVRVVVLDPPRDGAGGKVMRRIARAAPERIVYVSCNPATLARDLREIMPFGYRLAVIQPVDLFPQTYHVETVVLAKRGPGDGLRSAGPSALAGDDLPR